MTFRVNLPGSVFHGALGTLQRITCNGRAVVKLAEFPGTYVFAIADLQPLGV